MNKRMGEVGALLLSMGLLMMGNGLQSSLIALRASQEGFSTQVAGLLMSMYFVGFLAGSTRTPKIVARVGHVRVFAALASLASSAVVLHPLFINAWFWCGLRLISGFCIAGLFVIAELAQRGCQQCHARAPTVALRRGHHGCHGQRSNAAQSGPIRGASICSSS